MSDKQYWHRKLEAASDQSTSEKLRKTGLS
jgi:hypothetical protein